MTPFTRIALALVLGGALTSIFSLAPRAVEAQDEPFGDTTAEGMLPEPGMIPPDEGADGELPPVEDLEDAGDAPSIGEDSVEMGPADGELEVGDDPSIGEDSVETW